MFSILREYVKTQWNCLSGENRTKTFRIFPSRATKKSLVPCEYLVSFFMHACKHVAIGMNNLAFSATNSVQLTLTYGLSATQVHLALPLILFGIGSMAEGHKSGQLSLLVLETLKSKEWVPRVYILVYGIVIYCCEPVQVCLHVSNISIFSSPMRPSLVQVHWIHSFRRHGIKLWATCSLSVLADALH
jgi:hypothetical protein